jgi:prepilin peptidase CpaA
MIENLALVIFPALMLFAAFSDLLTMTIPNRVSALLIATYVVTAVYFHTPLATIGAHVGCGLAVLALTFTFFQFNWIGGGDAKLAAATALWLGWDNLLDYGLISSLAGGVLTLAILQLRSDWAPPRLLSFAFMQRLAQKNAGVPYGVALAFAGLLLYPETIFWSGVTGA